MPNYRNAKLQIGLRSRVPAEWLTLLRPKGPETDPMEPLDRFEALFKHFADQPYDPSAYRTFCNQWGLLFAVPAYGRAGPSHRLDADAETKAQRLARSRNATNRTDVPIEQVAAELSRLTTIPPKSKWGDGMAEVTVETQSAVLSIAAFHTILRSALGLCTRSEPQWVREYRHKNQLRQVQHGGDAAPLALLNGCSFFADARAHLSALVAHGITVAVEEGLETERPMLVLQPANLMTAIALQTVKYLSGDDAQCGVKLLQCKQCGTYFKVGPGTGRRSTSEFCNRKCQDRHSYLIRKQRQGAQP